MNEKRKSKKKRCPDYKQECHMKLGVIACCQVDHQNKVGCPVINYDKEDEEE